MKEPFGEPSSPLAESLSTSEMKARAEISIARDGGFARVYTARTMLWQVVVYERAAMQAQAA